MNTAVLFKYAVILSTFFMNEVCQWQREGEVIYEKYRFNLKQNDTL